MIIFIGALLSVIYLVLLAFLMSGLMIRSKPPKTGFESTPDITIIVVARDEEKNIGDCLSALLNQDFPKRKTQILIMDDGSRDNTYNIASSMTSENPKVRVIRNTASAKWKSRKKDALQQALRQAAGQFLFLTDADCRPGKSWIKDTLAEFENNTGLVAGFSPQQSTGPSVWNGFLFADSLSAAFASATTIGLKRGVTCTGRNLAIRKQAVLESGGYQNLPDSVSGDDDFILFQITRHPYWNVRYSFRESAHVPAFGPENFGEFLRQKKRHISAGRYFDPGRQAGYGIYHFANFGLWLTAMAGFWTNHFLIFPLLVKIFADWACLTLFTKKLSLKLNKIHFLVWEFLFPVYHILAAPGAMRGKISWKEDR